MTYYQLLFNTILNEDLLHWDYYRCHCGEDIDRIFKNPNSFIDWTFMCAKKDRLTSSVVFDEYQLNPLRFSDARAAHSVSSFFLGFVLASGLIGKDLNSFCSFDKLCAEYPFSYVWTLTSLYHDYGYQFETDYNLCDNLRRKTEESKSLMWREGRRSNWDYSVVKALWQLLKIDFSIWKPRYLNGFTAYQHKTEEDNIQRRSDSHLSHMPARKAIEYFIHDNIADFRCNNLSIDIPLRSCRTINNYLTYRLFDFNEYSCLDHGIAGGMFFYDRIIKSYIYEYQQKKEHFPQTNIEEFTIKNILDNELRIGLDQTILFLYIADCIVNHNIWKATDNSKSLYRQYGLGSLIGGRYKKVNFHKNPLLFILCMSDTLEPYKNFCRVAYGNSIDETSYNKNAVFDIFKEYKISVEKSIIKITVPEKWCERLNQMLNDMQFWIDISYSKSGNSFIVSVK